MSGGSVLTDRGHPSETSGERWKLFAGLVAVFALFHWLASRSAATGGRPRLLLRLL
jgi:hypothetical protein